MRVLENFAVVIEGTRCPQEVECLVSILIQKERFPPFQRRIFFPVGIQVGRRIDASVRATQDENGSLPEQQEDARACSAGSCMQSALSLATPVLAAVFSTTEELAAHEAQQEQA